MIDKRASAFSAPTKDCGTLRAGVPTIVCILARRRRKICVYPGPPQAKNPVINVVFLLFPSSTSPFFAFPVINVVFFALFPSSTSPLLRFLYLLASQENVAPLTLSLSVWRAVRHPSTRTEAPPFSAGACGGAPSDLSSLTKNGAGAPSSLTSVHVCPRGKSVTR